MLFHGGEVIDNKNNGIVEILGGSIEGKGYYPSGVKNSDSGKISIENCTININEYGGQGYAIKNVSDKDIIVSNCNISSNSYGIYNNGNGRINVSNSEINARNSIVNITGTIDSTENKITSNDNTTSGISNDSGEIRIKGGVISKGRYGIHNKKDGKIMQESGIIKDVSYGIFNSSNGNIEVLGGAINAKEVGINNNNGTIIIGNNKDETVKTDSPSISGIKYSIYNESGSVNFYDGTLLSFQENIIYGNIGEVQEGYQIKNNKDGVYSLTLEKASGDIVKLESNGKDYTKISDAIQDAQNNDKITILKDFNLSNIVVIPIDNELSIDLNGCIINEYFTIENKGTLTIIDTKKEGKINSNNGIGIKNTGKLKVLGGQINISTENEEYISKYVSSIYNSDYGSVYIIGGIISSNSIEENNKDIYGIYNVDNGTINVTGGTIKSSYCGIYNANNGKVHLAGGSITNIDDNNPSYDMYGIYNKNNGDIEVIGGDINISSTNRRTCGIYNEKEGKIVITDGKIFSKGVYNCYGIYNNDIGIITIGIKGDGIIDINNPNISATSLVSNNYEIYGIYNKAGTLNFYDGRIKGGKLAIYGLMTEYETNSTLSDITIANEVYLHTESSNEAKIENTEYKTLQDAINATDSNRKITIELLIGINLTSNREMIQIPEGKDITIDMKGKTISSSLVDVCMSNEGKLSIIDTLGNSKISGISNTLIYNTNKGELNISNTNIVNTKDGTSSNYKQLIKNEGLFEMSSGSINTEFEYTYPIKNSKQVKILGGETSGNVYGIYNENGLLEVAGGTIRGNNGIYNVEYGEVKINGGTIVSEGKGIYNNSIKNIEITGGIINIIRYGSSGIYNNNSGMIKFSGGTINNSNEAVMFYGIYNKAQGKIDVMGGNINIAGYRVYGIYNESTGNITLGQKGNGISEINTPTIIINKEKTGISSITNGIYNISGTLNFYDGIIKSPTIPILGNIAEIEDNTKLLEGTDEDSLKTVTLEESNENIASVNGIEYNNLQKAINACGENESTINILKNTLTESAVIADNQNITLNLTGYELKNYNGIINNGNLKITDTSETKTGTLMSSGDTVIQNNGDLEILEGNIKSNTYGIKNSNTLTVKGGNILENTYGIYNTSGTSTIEGGNISNNTSYGIYVNGGNTSITGGNITNNTNYGIYSNTGTTNITGGNITGSNYGVYNIANLNIENTTISTTQYGIYNVGAGISKVKEGTTINSDIGIYNYSTLEFGTSGTVNTETPIVIGEKYGIQNESSGIIKYYDGKIKGKLKAVQGMILYTQEGYKIKTETEGEYTVNSLAPAGTVTTVAKIGTTEFSNLQSAIDSAVGSEEVTITLVNGIITTTPFKVEAGQKIKLDMNGYTILSELENTIQNTGELKIVDTSGKNTAKISSTIAVAIQNSGSLNIGENDQLMVADMIIISGNTYGILNTGTLGFYDGKIEGGTSAVNGTINKREEGYIILTRTVDNKKQIYLGK